MSIVTIEYVCEPCLLLITSTAVEVEALVVSSYNMLPTFSAIDPGKCWGQIVTTLITFTTSKLLFRILHHLDLGKGLSALQA